MKAPSTRARSILEQYKSVESLDAADKDRLLDLIQQRGARGDLPRFDVQTSWPAAPSPSWPARLLGSTLGKVALGVTVAAVPVAVFLGVRHNRDASNAPAVSHEPLEGNEAQPENTAPGAPRSTEPAPPAHRGVSSPPIGAKPRARPDKLSDSPALPEGATEPTIDEEMRLLNAAQTSLRSGDAARSLQLLNEHASRFPASKLADAREIARMTTLCKLGQVQTARKEAERFVSKFPNSPFADRAKKICPPEAPP